MYKPTDDKQVDQQPMDFAPTFDFCNERAGDLKVHRFKIKIGLLDFQSVVFMTLVWCLLTPGI